MINILGALLWNKQTTFGLCKPKDGNSKKEMLAIKNQITEIQNTSDRGISRLDTAKEIISDLEGVSV